LKREHKERGGTSKTEQTDVGGKRVALLGSVDEKSHNDVPRSSR